MSTDSPGHVLQSFFNEMHEFEELYERRVGGPREVEDPVGFGNRLMDDLRGIWERWCAQPFGEKRPTAYGTPTEYGDGEVIESCEIVGGTATITTFGSPFFPKDKTVVHVYKLKMIDDRWRIVSRHELLDSGKLRKVSLLF